MLTAAQHQKISALQQIANLVSQAQSVAGNQAVLQNVVNSSLPLIRQWERSDPEFTQLAIYLRQARVAAGPQARANLVSQVNRMIMGVQGQLGPEINYQGDTVRWDPIYGKRSSPLYDPKEPVRSYSHMGWRGSQKYPMGIPFPTKNVIEGYDGSQKKFPLGILLVIGMIAVIIASGTMKPSAAH
jgi:hypothetical protein